MGCNWNGAESLCGFRCLFLCGKSPFHQWWGCFPNIKHHFQRGVVEAAPVGDPAGLAVIFLGHRAAPKDVLQCSKNGSCYWQRETKICINFI